MQESTESPSWTARTLLRAARQATLATQADGQPFAGLVTPATVSDGSVLLLLSDLSEHTKHLRHDGRCALMCVGDASEANPQTAPRVTVLGNATIEDTAVHRARFLAVHPYAALYAGFGDFHLWRVMLRSAAFVGGFARAFRFSAAELSPDLAAVAAVDAAAAEIIAHCNADHAETMALLSRAPGRASMVGVDTDGCDIAFGEATRRVGWTKPAASPDDIRRELIVLARAARAESPTPGAAADR